MPSATLPFRFDAVGLPAAPALIALMPAEISTKERLFDELAQRLRFPDYFGANWNALWACIRDLSWLPEGAVVLQHSDVPLTGDVASLKTYLSILNDATQKKWLVNGRDARDIVVIFPPESRERIAWLLHAASAEQRKRDRG